MECQRVHRILAANGELQNLHAAQRLQHGKIVLQAYSIQAHGKRVYLQLPKVPALLVHGKKLYPRVHKHPPNFIPEKNTFRVHGKIKVLRFQVQGKLVCPLVRKVHGRKVKAPQQQREFLGHQARQLGHQFRQWGHQFRQCGLFQLDMQAQFLLPPYSLTGLTCCLSFLLSHFYSCSSAFFPCDVLITSVIIDW